MRNKYITIFLFFLTIIIFILVLKKYNSQSIQYTFNTSPISVKEVLLYKGQEFDPQRKYIVVFFDYSCPFCELLDNNIQSVFKDYEVSLVYLHRPFESTSFNAGLAVECAREQDEFFPMHSYLLQRNNRLESIDFLNIADKIDIKNSKKYFQCYNSSKYSSVLKNDIMLADSLLIDAVPAFIINNKLFKGVMSVEQLKNELKISD